MQEQADTSYSSGSLGWILGGVWSSETWFLEQNFNKCI